MRGLRNISALTLVEVLTVVGIVAIIITVGANSYQSYTVRARILDGIGIADKYKKNAERNYLADGIWPLDADIDTWTSSGIVDHVKYINTTVATRPALQILVFFDEDAVPRLDTGGSAFDNCGQNQITPCGGVIIFQGQINSDNILNWECGTLNTRHGINFSHLPVDCRQVL